jgi:hypothetical protein
MNPALWVNRVPRRSFAVFFDRSVDRALIARGRSQSAGGHLPQRAAALSSCWGSSVQISLASCDFGIEDGLGKMWNYCLEVEFFVAHHISGAYAALNLGGILGGSVSLDTG